MATKKITDLTAASSAALTDLVPIVDMTGPTTKKATVSQLLAGGVATGTGIPHIVAGAQSPAASLIVNADVHASAAIALSKLAPIVAIENNALAGTQHNVVLSTENTVPITIVRVTDALAVDWSGMQGGVDGRIVIVMYTGGVTLTLWNEDANSLAENRFSYYGGAPPSMTVGRATIFIYDTTISRWRAYLL